LGLTACQTTPVPQRIEIPPYPVPRPERPVLEEIPTNDIVAMTKAFTINMTKLTKHIEKLELYDQLKDKYYTSM
jgi:hypothetical protein